MGTLYISIRYVGYGGTLSNIMYDRRSFYRNNQTVKFLKGEMILLHDETPKNIYSIKSGVVELFSTTSEGDHQTIAFQIIGDILPIGWALSKIPKLLFDFNAYTDCELYVISLEDFQTQLAFNIDFTKKMLHRSVGLTSGLMLKIEALEKPHAKQKLLYTFRYLCLLYGTNRWNGFVRIEVPLTQQVLADLTGLTRETTNMEINNLKKLKIITSYQKYYTVDTSKMNDKIDGDYEPEKSLSMLRKKF